MVVFYFSTQHAYADEAGHPIEATLSGDGGGSDTTTAGDSDVFAE